MNGYLINSENALSEAKNLITQKTTDDLNKLMSSDEELTKFMGNLSEIQQMEVVKENFKQNIKHLALRNLDKEPRFLQEKQKLTDIYEEISKAKDEYKRIRQIYDDQTNESNPEMIYILLQTAASDLEQKTEEKADSFFYGEKTEEQVTEFERQFIDDRKRAHELKIKAEKFNELFQMSEATLYSNSSSRSHYPGYH